MKEWVIWQVHYVQINNRDCLSSPDVKSDLDNMHKDFVAVPIDKATGNITLGL